MSQKGCKSKSPKSPRSKSSSCHAVENERAEEECASRTTFEELQKEIERELQNSEKILSAASNYKGSISRDVFSARASRVQSRSRSSAEQEVDLGENRNRFDMMGCEDEENHEDFNAYGVGEDYALRPRLTDSPGALNMKKTSVRLSLPDGKTRSKNHHSSMNESWEEARYLGIRKFSQPETYHHDHHHESRNKLPALDEKSKKSLSHLSKLKKTPSHFGCELDKNLEFLKICWPKVKEERRGGVRKLPETPCLCKEEIEDLIKCEAQDVESAWHLASNEKQTYKKPCPKQQKAQMNIKALVQASKASIQTCVQKYSPLEHPEPEDISPEVAASMMFLQEQGVKMEECPSDTITRLFPDCPRPPFSKKGSFSVVDPNDKDQEEMIEKSASVPSEGVSDSAYTRTMRGKDLGPQRSYDADTALGHSKREYVIVAQKPQRVNVVQFRGGSAPSWFPWYFSSFPDDNDGLKLVTSPSELFHKAWLHSNPDNMPTNDVIVLD